MPRYRILYAHCHGCNNAMDIQAVPVVLTDLTGKREKFYGKEDAAWICGVCRLEPAKLKAARLACGLPAEPEMLRFEDDLI